MVERDVLEWFLNGRIGISSRAMAAAAVGIPYTRYLGDNHPHDPADFNRCLLLLEKAPEVRQSFDKVAALSPVWAALVARWDEIEQCLLDEVGLNWSKGRQLHAERTYNLMRSIIDPAESAQEFTGEGSNE